MKENDLTAEFYEIMHRSMERAREQAAAPPLRDVLKREHDEAQRRPRNEALEKWGPIIEEQIERDLERTRHRQPKLPGKSPIPGNHPRKDEPDMDMG
jgi:hypothetical protein